MHYSFPTLHVSYTDLCTASVCVLCTTEGGTTFAWLCFVSLHQQQTGRSAVGSDMGVCVIDGGPKKVCPCQCGSCSSAQLRSCGSSADGTGGLEDVGSRNWGARVVMTLLESALDICLLAPWKSGFHV